MSQNVYKSFDHSKKYPRHQEHVKVNKLATLPDQALSPKVAGTEMAYMASLPESREGGADCLLVCKDKKLLPCHSLILASASKILAGLYDSVRSEIDMKIKIPMEEDSEVVQAFLGWVYGHTITFEAPMAYPLAYLAHRLDSPGARLPS